jgi:hypothetical protein
VFKYVCYFHFTETLEIPAQFCYHQQKGISRWTPGVKFKKEVAINHLITGWVKKPPYTTPSPSIPLIQGEGE